MSKSGQPATKADTGGQRVPKTDDGQSGKDKPATVKPPAPEKKTSPKK